MLLSLAPVTARVATSTAAAPPDVWGIAVSQFAGYGVVGLCCIVLGVVVSRLWVKGQKDAQATLEREIERTRLERERADRAERATLDLNRELREKVVPLLTEVARVSAELLALNRNRDR